MLGFPSLTIVFSKHGQSGPESAHQRGRYSQSRWGADWMPLGPASVSSVTPPIPAAVLVARLCDGFNSLHCNRICPGAYGCPFCSGTSLKLCTPVGVHLACPCAAKSMARSGTFGIRPKSPMRGATRRVQVRPTTRTPMPPGCLGHHLLPSPHLWSHGTARTCTTTREQKKSPGARSVDQQAPLMGGAEDGSPPHCRLT